MPISLYLKRFFSIISLFALCVSLGWAQQWSESFETGTGGAASYHKDEDATTFEVRTDGAAEGDSYLRATLNTTKNLAGFSVNATGLEGGRVARVSAQVRGRGFVWLCTQIGGRWLYSQSTVELDETRWQTVTMERVLAEGETSMGIYFLSREAAREGDYYDVDNVQVSLAPPLELFDAEVRPWRFELEAYAAASNQVTNIDDALGGKAIRSDNYALATGIPFPRTSRPVSVYLRVRPGAEQETYTLHTLQPGRLQAMAVQSPASAGTWQWVAFPPMSAAEIGNVLAVTFNRERGVPGTTLLDSLVISTADNLVAEILAGAPQLDHQRPLVTAVRTATPPVIDGSGSDPAWNNAVAATNFITTRSLAPAASETTVKMLYDDTNLYVQFRCEETILLLHEQRVHEFRANVEERDGNVYADDSCVVLIDPAQDGTQVRDFTVNALGTIADAMCSGPDLWSRRDLTWDSGARAEGTIEDGYYTVEMALPLADLSATMPRDGDVWGVVLGRIARARDETSAWNVVNTGFHDLSAFGYLRFAENGIGATVTAPANLQAAGNILGAALAPRSAGAPQGVYLATSIAMPERVNRTYTFAATGDAAQQAEHRFNMVEDMQVQIDWALLDAGTLTPIYLSPTLPRAVSASTATLALSTEGPWALYNNGRVVQQGPRAEQAEIEIPLENGPNTLSLRLDTGTAALAMSAPGVEIDGTGWRIVPEDATDAMLPTTNDNTWQMAPTVGQDPQLGPVVGVADTATTLRRTVLWEKTRAWPTPDPALYVARGTAQHITFTAEGLQGRALDEWTTYVAVPPAFDIVGSTGYYGNSNPTQPRFLMTQLGEQDVNGVTMNVAMVQTDKPLLSGRHYIMSLFNVFVRYREEAGDPGDEEFTFVYWSEADGGSVVEGRQHFNVRVLPPIDGRQPEKNTWQLWGSFFSNIDDIDMIEEIMKTSQAIGFNDLVTGGRDLSELATRYKIKTTMLVNFEPWSINMAPFAAEHNVPLIRPDGTPSDKYICNSALMEEGWGQVEARLREILEAFKVNTIDYDYEFGVFDSHHSCYCPRCLASFREYAELAADTTLDGEIIRTEYPEQWTDFMNWQVAKMMRVFKDTIHAIRPGTLFSVYSGYQDGLTKQRYGIDWKMFGDLQAADKIGCGYGRNDQEILDTVEAVQGIPTHFGAIANPYSIQRTYPQVPISRARLLTRALDSTGGVLVYTRLPLDGRTWHAVADITRLVAQYEDAFYGKSISPYGEWPTGQVQIVSANGVTLLCVMNNSDRQMEITLPIPDNLGEGTEFYTGRKVSAGENAALSLGGGDVAVFVFGG